MWRVSYHPEVERDLKSLGNASAKRILKAIEERIINGEPHKIGKTLSHDLQGRRRIRVGDTRIIYRIYSDKIEVLIVAVGPRKKQMIYKRARKRFGT